MRQSPPSHQDVKIASSAPYLILLGIVLFATILLSLLGGDALDAALPQIEITAAEWAEVRLWTLSGLMLTATVIGLMLFMRWYTERIPALGEVIDEEKLRLVLDDLWQQEDLTPGKVMHLFRRARSEYARRLEEARQETHQVRTTTRLEVERLYQEQMAQLQAHHAQTMILVQGQLAQALADQADVRLEAEQLRAQLALAAKERTEVEALQADLGSAQERIKVLERNLSEARTREGELSGKIAGMEESERAQQEQMAALQDQVAEAAAADTHNKALQAEVEREKAAREQLRQEAATFFRQQQAVQGRLESERQSLRQELVRRPAYVTLELKTPSEMPDDLVIRHLCAFLASVTLPRPNGSEDAFLASWRRQRRLFQRLNAEKFFWVYNPEDPPSFLAQPTLLAAAVAPPVEAERTQIVEVPAVVRHRPERAPAPVEPDPAPQSTTSPASQEAAARDQPPGDDQAVPAQRWLRRALRHGAGPRRWRAEPLTASSQEVAGSA